jgi:hypothetical protein
MRILFRRRLMPANAGVKSALRTAGDKTPLRGGRA